MSNSDKDNTSKAAPASDADEFKVEYETDPNAHNRVEPEYRGPGMDEPVHYTYARPEDKPAERDVRVCEAVKADDQTLVRKLVEDEGCDIHQRAEQDWTPLNFAAGKGDLEMVELLIELGADITATGRDNRRPLMIARAASRKEMVKFITEREKKLGVWEDPTILRPYCKAYYLRDLRSFESWSEKRDHWKINKYWSDDMKADFEKDLEGGDVVFVHQDFSVTRSMWKGEHVIYDDVSPGWETFCKDQLKFAIPEDLQ